MIRYDPFWKTLKEKQISQYRLTEYYEISSSTLSKMKHNQICSLHTIDRLCDTIFWTVQYLILLNITKKMIQNEWDYIILFMYRKNQQTSHT